MDKGTGWERSRRVHFDEIVEGYNKARGDYPIELYDDIFNYNQAGKNAVEIGAGTGLATTHFLNNGYNVTTIEMGSNMVGFLNQKFSGNQMLLHFSGGLKYSHPPVGYLDHINMSIFYRYYLYRISEWV